MKQGFTSVLKSAAGGVQFTTNSAVDFVAITQAAPVDMLPAQTGTPFFNEGDNLIIESVGVIFPYQFTWAEKVMSIELEKQNRSATVTAPLIEFGLGGRFHLPMCNTMFNFDTFIDADIVTFTEDYKIRLKDTIDGQVSMANMPTQLNAKTFDVHIVAFVHSTEAMRI